MPEKLLPSQFHQSMRGEFAGNLYNAMVDHPEIWVITGDLGFGMLDIVKKDFPKRFVNTGAAEQAMMDIAIGLALEGKKPFVYSITPFLLYRPFESLRTYIDHERIPVRLVGGGRDQDYSHDGYSHHADDARAVLGVLKNVRQLWPEHNQDVRKMVHLMVDENRPWFISLRR